MTDEVAKLAKYLGNRLMSLQEKYSKKPVREIKITGGRTSGGVSYYIEFYFWYPSKESKRGAYKIWSIRVSDHGVGTYRSINEQNFHVENYADADLLIKRIESVISSL